MNERDWARSGKVRSLGGGASMIVLTALLATAAPSVAMAQAASAGTADGATPSSAETDPDAAASPEAAEEIIVTGQRRALQTSQQIKRNADTVVDSITATDIGAFPDKSVAEALQRVPGITVNRFAASDDTAHFSAEPSGVIVRGLPQVRSEFNGRDTFSANSSRGLGWGDVSPELMAGVDTYKNQTAELIEGGIAGTVNLRTRVPFDAPGQLIQGTLNFNYGDISKKLTPEFSGFYSNRWETGIGELGLMANVAFSQVETASQGIQYGRMGIVEDSFGEGTKFIPSQVFTRDNLYDRERQGIALAGQWQDVDRRFLVTAQFNRSTYKNSWKERAVGGLLFDLWATDVRFRLRPGGDRATQIPLAAPGTPAFTFDDEGRFLSGEFVRPDGALWWGCPTGNPPWGGTQADYGCGLPTNAGYALNDEGEPMFPTCYSWAGSCSGPFGWASEVQTTSRYSSSRSMTQDAALNFKWEATDRLRFNFDGQYVDSDVDNYDVNVEHGSFANVAIDATGGRPLISFNPALNINQSQGGLANPNNWYLRAVQDHIEDSEGQQLAFRADAEYDLDSDWLDSLKVGVRYADRDQEVRNSAFNWSNIANTWTTDSAPYWNLDSQPSGSFAGYPDGHNATYEFGGDFFGGSLGEFQFVPFDFLTGRRVGEFAQSRIGVGTFTPICERGAEMEGSCFTPNEINRVSESTEAAFAMLRFGGDNSYVGGLRLSGNVGVRYVQTTNRSTGSLMYATPTYDFDVCDGPPSQPPPGMPPTAPYPAFCYLSDGDLALGSGGGEETTVGRKHRHWLPSFNMRVDLNEQWLVRFAASRALSRPDIGLLKNYVRITQSLPNSTDLSDSRWVRNGAGDITGVNPTYTADAFNPYLAPTTAWQFDLTLEHYFADVGSFTLAAFHKQFSNYIQYGAYERDVTRGGTTRPVLVRGPMNGDGAKIQGIEVAYQRFFDFLPAPLDGLGFQGNYTYVHNEGVPNANLRIGGDTGQTTGEGNAGTALNAGALEGLSKHAFNVVGMYEKGRIAARLAYNWRSKYLVTAVDCCVLLPVWQNSAGFLDGSIRYRLTDSIELSVQGSNLLNTKTVLRQQVTDEESPEGRAILTPNGWFQNDRRFVFGARVKF